MAYHYQLSTDEQIWVMIRVKQGLMSMQEALEYVRKQHEEAGLPPVVAPCHTYSSLTASLSSSSASDSRANSQSPSQQDRLLCRNRGRSLLKHFSSKRSTGRDISLENEAYCNGSLSTFKARSLDTLWSADKDRERSDVLLDLMLAQGKISSEDHKELLRTFTNITSYKDGDAQRMILGNLVKTGRISIDDAVHYSRLLGVVSSAETEARTIAEVNNAFQDKKVYNFGVYKYYKHRSCQRRILQIDFQSCQICSIQKGNLNRIFAFGQVMDYDSEEGLRFFIYFRGHQDYELEADTQEEKQKICRLLCLIVENNKTSAKGRVLTQADFRGTLMRCQQVVKEGFLEKKNHNLYTTYTRRWIRIREGELSYYKPDDDNQQALNILQLSDDATVIKKLSYNGFSITTRKKVYLMIPKKHKKAEKRISFQVRFYAGEKNVQRQGTHSDGFRIVANSSTSSLDIEKERDEWFKAIRFACGDRRQSVAFFGSEEPVSKRNIPEKHRRESFYQAFKHFQEELERLSIVVNTLDERGDASKVLMQLQQKAKVIETLFSQVRPPSDSSAVSTSVDTETSSHLEQSSTQSVEPSGDQTVEEPLPPLIKSDRQSIVIGNNWVLHNSNASGLPNGHALIVDPPEENGGNRTGNDETQRITSLEQRTSLLLNSSTSSSSLSAVFERKCLRNKEITSKNLHNDISSVQRNHSNSSENLAAEKLLGLSQKKLDDKLPPLLVPPPLIIDTGFAPQERLHKEPSPPPLCKTQSAVEKTQPHLSPKGTKKEQLPLIMGLSEDVLPSLSATQKRRMWYASQSNLSYPFKHPPPLPLRHPETETNVKKVEYSGPKYEEPDNSCEIPPPLPPRQNLVDREVEGRSKASEQRPNKSKVQQMSPNKKNKNGGQSFWRNLKQAKMFSSSSSTSVNKIKSPPPLPPRVAASNEYSNEFPRQPSSETAPESKDDATNDTSSRPAFVPPPPAPPPPPEMAAPVTRKFEVTSNVKMRPFHWNKVSGLMIKKSIWQNARDLTGKIDTELLKHMYSEKKDGDASHQPEKVAVESLKKKLKSFLDPKIAQNLGIFLAGFKMEAEELKFRLAIISEDEGGLSSEQINLLRRYHPTAEDIETYKTFKDRQEELENTDQFMLQLCEIPHLKTRLDVLMVINELPTQYEDLAPTVDRVYDICKLLCSSEKFVSVLEHVLAAGNFINSGSAQGVSMGFRLTTLPKLAEHRGKDKTCTLLKYVVQQIHKHSPALVSFIDEFMPACLITDVSVKALEAEVEIMKRDLNNVRKNTAILLKVDNPPERDVVFCEDVAGFVERYELKLVQLQKKSDAMKALYDQLLERFAEPRGVDSSSIFTAIGDFVKAFKRELDLILAGTGHGRKKSKTKINHSYLKNDGRAPKFQQPSAIVDSERNISNGGVHINDASLGHVATLRKAFSADESKPYSKQGREILKVFQTRKQDKRPPWNPTKEGYLDKLSNTKSPLASSWNRRFFELTTKGHLYYSKRKNEKNVESIYLRGVPVTLEDDKTLILQTEERSFKLRAHSHKEAQEWLECLLFYTHKPASVPKPSVTSKQFDAQ